MIVSAQGGPGPKRTGVVIEVQDADLDLRSPGGRDCRLRFRLSPHDVAILFQALGRLVVGDVGEDDVHEQDEAGGAP